MARKGSRKVRTGCITCKVRKIKCDEARPSCLRCTSTGRKCDGYLAPRTALRHDNDNNSGSACVRLSASLGSRLKVAVADAGEARALDFFRLVVAPAISGHLASDFWTHVVLQVGQLEPAVRHASVAVSALYEEFDRGGPVGDGGSGDARFAVGHYNRAIAHLVGQQDENVVLLVCVLFICIEFLQGDVHRAISHCRHGVSILNNHAAPRRMSSLARDELVAVFRRLSLFPFFFGSTPANFPTLTEMASPAAALEPCADQVPDLVAGVKELAAELDVLMFHSVRLVRLGDDYKVGEMRSFPIPLDLLEDQRDLDDAFALWEYQFAAAVAATNNNTSSPPSSSSSSSSSPPPLPSFSTCQGQSSGSGNGSKWVSLRSYDTGMIYTILELRFLVAKIWASNAFERDEAAFDGHLASFARVVELAARMLPGPTGTGTGTGTSTGDPGPGGCAPPPARPKFIFEMGFSPFLYFVVVKCRHLETRLAALGLMRALAVEREGLWNVFDMYAVGRRIVEMEHGFGAVGCEALPGGYGPGGPCAELEHIRFVDSYVEPGAVLHCECLGVRQCNRVTFILSSEGGSRRVFREWVMSPVG